jgi:glyceraldehyde 3-phosphate dehydrogenase
MAIRVPNTTVSIVDLVCLVEKNTTKDEVLNIFRSEAQKEKYQNILRVEDLPLVSSDYIKSSYSSIIDSEMVSVNNNMIKILSWYDNEWGYSARLADFTNYIAKKL